MSAECHVCGHDLAPDAGGLAPCEYCELRSRAENAEAALAAREEPPRQAEIRAILAAVAFTYADELSEEIQERLGDADDGLIGTIAKLVKLREDTERPDERLPGGDIYIKRGPEHEAFSLATSEAAEKFDERDEEMSWVWMSAKLFFARPAVLDTEQEHER